MNYKPKSSNLSEWLQGYFYFDIHRSIRICIPLAFLWISWSIQGLNFICHVLSSPSDYNVKHVARITSCCKQFQCKASLSEHICCKAVSRFWWIWMEECSLRSFTTIDSQVVFGHPMGHLTGFTKWRSDCLAVILEKMRTLPPARASPARARQFFNCFPCLPQLLQTNFYQPPSPCIFQETTLLCHHPCPTQKFWSYSSNDILHATFSLLVTVHRTVSS